MSGGNGGLSKLGTALIIIFVISLTALFAELFYVLWRRRLFRRRATTVSNSGGDGNVDQISQYTSSDSNFSPIASSKELLYFFCVRPHARLERTAAIANTPNTGIDSTDQSEIEVIDFDLVKIQGMFGPPRFLFTIKEEEREDMDSPAEKSLNPSVDEKVKKKKKCDDERDGIGRVSLEDCFNVEAEESVVVVVEIDDNTTPFSTPCASPLYFTPTASPAHEAMMNCPPLDELRAFSEV